MGSTAEKMSVMDIMKVVGSCKEASHPGKSKDGSRIHVVYKKGEKRNKQAEEEAKTAKALGLDDDHYTGRLDHVWESKAKEILVTMLVELEREDDDGDPVYRTFNLKKGELIAIKKMGD